MSLRALIVRHMTRTAVQLVDSTIPTTREWWRTEAGYPEHAHDPRPLRECIERTR